MLNSLAALIPRPVKDVFMAPLAARENPDLAANRLIKASIRIAIVSIGIFSTYKLMRVQGWFWGFLARCTLPLAVVYTASIPAGHMMYGFELLSGGVLMLVHLLSLESFTLLSISLNLLISGVCILPMVGGWFCIHLADEESAAPMEYSGFIEPTINTFANGYQTYLASLLRRF